MIGKCSGVKVPWWVPIGMVLAGAVFITAAVLLFAAYVQVSG